MKEAKREPYPSDLTDAQWKFIGPLLPPGQARNNFYEINKINCLHDKHDVIL
jgi:hypothetical protein